MVILYPSRNDVERVTYTNERFQRLKYRLQSEIVKTEVSLLSDHQQILILDEILSTPYNYQASRSAFYDLRSVLSIRPKNSRLAQVLKKFDEKGNEAYHTLVSNSCFRKK